MRQLRRRTVRVPSPLSLTRNQNEDTSVYTMASSISTIKTLINMIVDRVPRKIESITKAEGRRGC